MADNGFVTELFQDSSDVNSSIPAGAGVQDLTLPLTSLVTGLGTGAVTLLNGLTPGYNGVIKSLDFVTTVAGTGSGASQTFNLDINTTPTTGGSLVLTLSNQGTVGTVTAATSITAANTFGPTDTLSLKMAAGGTVFTAGAGYFVVSIQNLDTGTLRTELVQRGLVPA